MPQNKVGKGIGTLMNVLSKTVKGHQIWNKYLVLSIWNRGILKLPKKIQENAKCLKVEVS